MRGLLCESYRCRPILLRRFVDQVKAVRCDSCLSSDEKTERGRMGDFPVFVMDTSALLALRDNESGSGEVEELLRGAARRECAVQVSFISRMELLYILWREEGEAAARHALRLVDAFSIEWVSCDPEILDTAARLKAGGKLSLADSWIAATAIVHAATLVHKDPELDSVTVPQKRL